MQVAKRLLRTGNQKIPILGKFGKKIAKQNLVISTIALTLAFCVWYLWATIAAQLNGAGFHFTTEQLFTLAALPGLVGATLRFVYTYMPALMGGKNWTFISTLILLVPVVWLGFAVQDTTTSYTTFYDFNSPHRFSGC